MTAHISVYDPSAPYRSEGQHKRTTLDTLTGKVVGFVDNTKPNFNHLADDLAGLLKSRYGVRDALIFRKRAPSIAAPEEIMGEVATRCDLVITGSGD
jgi:hypothetical protein